MRRLPVLVLHANKRCNCRCVMCSIWKSTDESKLTPEALCRLLPDIRSLGVEHVAFTGGEPLMNPWLPQLCSMLKDAGVHVTLLTTGILLGRFAEVVVKVTDDIVVSLDGPREVHEMIRRSVGCYDLLASGVRAVLEAAPGFPVSGRCTVQKLNCRALGQTVDAAQEIGLRSISFLAADLTSSTFNRESPLTVVQSSALGLSEADVGTLEEAIGELERGHGADFESGFIAESPEKLRRMIRHFQAHLGLADAVAPRCNAPWVSAVMETDGTLRPCFFHEPVGNALERGLEAALNGPAAVGFRENLRIEENEVCRRCVCSLYRVNTIASV
jgi:MoaA/NifB/PqqE/SkfB family radical SAM enzyme